MEVESYVMWRDRSDKEKKKLETFHNGQEKVREGRAITMRNKQ